MSICSSQPFPILHEVDGEGKTGLTRAVPVDELPVRLPELEDYKPSGRPEPPLEKAEDWVWVTRDGQRLRRETNTMPQWAGSCWYYLRYIDPNNDSALIDPAKERYWMPVDLYVGGAEHAVLHLLYARFWHKVLYDAGVVKHNEPFRKLVHQGMIMGEDGEKMSKSRGNVINPDSVVDRYGDGHASDVRDVHGPARACIRRSTMREVRVRREAVQSLGLIGGQKANGLLVRALNDADVRIRCIAGINLGKAGKAAGLIPLLEVIQTREFHKREGAEIRACFEAVGMAGSNESIPVLRQLLERKSLFGRGKMDEIRMGAASALAMIGTPEARAVLELGKDSKDESIREACLQALRGKTPREPTV